MSRFKWQTSTYSERIDYVFKKYFHIIITTNWSISAIMDLIGDGSIIGFTKEEGIGTMVWWEDAANSSHVKVLN